MIAEKVNVSACLNQAFSRMKGLLFPFSFSKWLTLGLCAWVLGIGENGGNSCNGISNFVEKAIKSIKGDRTLLEILNTLFWGEGTVFERIAGLLSAEAAIIQFIALLLVCFSVIILALLVAIAYFKGRMIFVWLDNLLWNKAEIQPAYNNFKKQGLDFFKGKLFIDIWYYLLCLLLSSMALYPGLRYLRESARLGEWLNVDFPLAAGLVLLVILGILNIPVLIYLGLLFRFTPLIMYKKGITFQEALAEFNLLLFSRKIQFFKYFCFDWLINIAAGTLTALLICCSCCILALPLTLPVIGATMLLPWHVIHSCLAIEFYEKLMEK